MGSLTDNSEFLLKHRNLEMNPVISLLLHNEVAVKHQRLEYVYRSVESYY